ncbi:baseplate J/gp47 family protein [Acidocella sp.]|uniref:baseplate J/gp47 family protein n=1 Tax=Acidocella sp. TaxID=50710 RepID=UPI0026348696|nr:baseplate J/gp47 family protein [Acidocella sp.]
MQLTLQNFSTLVESMAASVQGAASTLLDLTIGSVLRAILEANAGIALWLQWLIVQVLATTRLATSIGLDCDSFCGDFGLTRLSAVAASGKVTFSRFSPGIQSIIPLGTNVTTSDNKQTFIIIEDFNNPDYNGDLRGYVLASGIASVDALAIAALPGAAGNIQAGGISSLSSAIAGIDAVVNSAPFSGGLDAESDTAFRARFPLYLAGLSKATNAAINSTILGIQQGASCSISENISQDGAVKMGHFVITVDDGSGYPSDTFISTVQQSVEAIRPIGTNFAVQGPRVSQADISMNLTTNSVAVHGSSVAAVSEAINAYISSLPVGGALSYTKLVQLAYDSSEYITNISNLLLNGETSDLLTSPFEVVRAGVIAVS